MADEERRIELEQRSRSFLARLSLEDDDPGTQNWDTMLTKALDQKGAGAVALFMDSASGGWNKPVPGSNSVAEISKRNKKSDYDEQKVATLRGCQRCAADHTGPANAMESTRSRDSFRFGQNDSPHSHGMLDNGASVPWKSLALQQKRKSNLEVEGQNTLTSDVGARDPDHLVMLGSPSPRRGGKGALAKRDLRQSSDILSVNVLDFVEVKSALQNESLLGIFRCTL